MNEDQFKLDIFRNPALFVFAVRADGNVSISMLQSGVRLHEQPWSAACRHSHMYTHQILVQTGLFFFSFPWLLLVIHTAVVVAWGVSSGTAEGIHPPSAKRRSTDTSESLFAACWICNHAFVELKSAVCSSSQTKRQGKYNPACTHTHTHIRVREWLGGGKLYCQDTQGPNCLFPLCCF